MVLSKTPKTIFPKEINEEKVENLQYFIENESKLRLFYSFHMKMNIKNEF